MSKCSEFNSNHNEGYNKKPWISEDTVDISRAALHTIFNQSSRAHTNTNMQSYAGQELFVVLRPFLEGQFCDLHNGGAGLWKSAQAVIFTLALSTWSVIGHTDSRSSRTCISNGGIISDIQHRGSYGFCIKIPLPEGARCVYMGLRFLLLSSASPYANTCSICKRIIFLQGYLEWARHIQLPVWMGTGCMFCIVIYVLLAMRYGMGLNIFHTTPRQGLPALVLRICQTLFFPVMWCWVCQNHECVLQHVCTSVHCTQTTKRTYHIS